MEGPEHSLDVQRICADRNDKRPWFVFVFNLIVFFTYFTTRYTHRAEMAVLSHRTVICTCIAKKERKGNRCALLSNN